MFRAYTAHLQTRFIDTVAQLPKSKQQRLDDSWAWTFYRDVFCRIDEAPFAVLYVMLPGVSGLAGTPRLKALLPALRVILISAHADEAGALRRAALQAGAEAFVPKDSLELKVVRAWKLQNCSQPGSFGIGGRL